jgi:hypothetical protein
MGRARERGKGARAPAAARAKPALRSAAGRLAPLDPQSPCAPPPTCHSYINSGGLMWENAPALSALLVWAEHRYYGQSQPFGGPRRACVRPD